MEVERLKKLAARLREILAEADRADLSHGQALDLIAALPGLRDWPEVVAFPSRVADCELNKSSAERVVRRLRDRWAIDWHPGALLYTLELAEFHAVTPKRNGFERLILTPGDSGAGHLKAARVADKVIALDRGDDFICGPVPSGETPTAFFRNRDRAYDAGLKEWSQWEWLHEAPALETWNEVLADCRRFERIELWVDPVPRHQLLFLRTAAWLAQHDEIRTKLYVVHAPEELGEREPQHFASSNAFAQPLGSNELNLVRAAWDAFREPTPRGWYALLPQNLDALPALRRTVSLLLAELPDANTGVTASQLSLLQPMRSGEMQAVHLLTRAPQGIDRACDYWSLGRLLVDLARAETPAITGLANDLFDTALHDDPERRRHFNQSRVSLSPLGAAIVAGRDDFTAHNSINRWWGGTHLTDTNLWRWDAVRQRLITPS